MIISIGRKTLCTPYDALVNVAVPSTVIIHAISASRQPLQEPFLLISPAVPQESCLPW